MNIPPALKVYQLTGHRLGVKHITSSMCKAPGHTGQSPSALSSSVHTTGHGQDITIAQTQTEAPPDECPQLPNLFPDLVAALGVLQLFCLV